MQVNSLQSLTFSVSYTNAAGTALPEITGESWSVLAPDGSPSTLFTLAIDPTDAEKGTAGPATGTGSCKLHVELGTLILESEQLDVADNVPFAGAISVTAV